MNLHEAREAADLAVAAVTAAYEEPAKVAVSMLSAALWYAQQGLRVFPLSPGTKIPYKGSNGCLSASSNPDVIRGWWETDPTSNIGIATGHLIDVVDIDGAPGQLSRGENWCAEGRACETRGMKRLPWDVNDCDHGPGRFAKIDAEKLAVVLTPRPGGMHMYVPAQGRPNRAGIFPGIDYRGTGGYVLAPPSVVTEGPNPGTYRFLGTPTFDQLGANA